VKKQPAVTNKSQSIRDAFTELGKKARPKDIIAALAARGIDVSHALVGSTLKAAGLRRGRRRRKVVAVVAARMPSANGHGFMIDELLKVKKLADELGGTDKIKELVVALEQLV
jgi:ABC-type nitrate/sulfonate/bicarbonate transport system substrate-binding protein